MRDDRHATIAIERTAAGGWEPFPVWVWIDDRLVGRVHPRKRGEFTAPAGEHSVAVTAGYASGRCLAGPLPIVVDPGGRVELVCRLYLPPVHPWHRHSFHMVFLYGVLLAVGIVVPPIRDFMREYLMTELFIALALGWVGMIISCCRSIGPNACRPALALEMISESEAPCYRPPGKQCPVDVA